MPRYASQNLAAFNPEYRKANNLGSSGGDGKSNRYTYGKSVFIASGTDLFADGFTIRFLPIYDESAKDAEGNRQFVNFREGRDNAAFGDWSRRMECAHWVGNPGVCFIIHDGNPDLNPYDSPYWLLRGIAWKNSSRDKSGVAHPTLGRLFDELLSDNVVFKSHVGSLRRPEPVLFVSASTVELDERGRPVLMAFSDDPKKNARVIGLKKSCAESLLSCLAARDEQTGEYLSGDMLAADAAKLATFVPNGYQSHPPRNVSAFSAQGPTGIQVPRRCQQQTPVISGYPAKPSDMTYRAIVHDSFGGHPVTLEPYAEQLVAETLSFDQYLHVPTYMEQAELLAKAFPREALQFCWQENPEYLRALPRGTTTVEIGGRHVEDLDESEAPAVAPRGSAAQRFAPQRPIGESAAQALATAASLPDAELSDDEAAGVDGMFAAGADSAPPAAPAAAQRSPSNVADIIAKARLAAARNR
jgi:hypothetical protein